MDHTAAHRHGHLDGTLAQSGARERAQASVRQREIDRPLRCVRHARERRRRRAYLSRKARMRQSG
eukprot:6212340-Pleurochrysis_carterae.AAC.3